MTERVNNSNKRSKIKISKSLADGRDKKTSKKPKSSITRVGLAARHLKHSAKSLWKHVKPLKMPLVGLPWWSSG